MRSDRFSRHWHDLSRLDKAGISAAAIEDRALPAAVARHKTMFFSEKAADGENISYGAAIAGHLQLVPSGEALNALAEDYCGMTEDGLLATAPEPFDVLMERCADIALRRWPRAVPVEPPRILALQAFDFAGADFVLNRLMTYKDKDNS